MTIAMMVLLGVGAACGDPATDEPAKEGELGVGTFLYRCVGDSDPACDEGGTAENFPEAFAVGGRFSLDYNQDRDGALPNVVPASDSIQRDGPALVVVRAGWSAVLATQGFGDVIDLLHLAGRDVTRIALFTGDSQELSDITMAVGDTLVLEGRPQDDNRTTLAGSLDYAWSSDDDTIVRVASADLDESVQIEAVAAGSGMVMVTAGSFTQMIPVQVGGDASTGADDAGSSDDDTDGDTAGQDTDGSDTDGADTDGSDTDGSDTDGSGTTGSDTAGSDTAGEDTAGSTGGTAG